MLNTDGRVPMKIKITTLILFVFIQGCAAIPIGMMAAGAACNYYPECAAAKVVVKQVKNRRP